MHREVDHGHGTQLLELFSATGSVAKCWVQGRRLVLPLTELIGEALRKEEEELSAPCGETL